MRDDSAEAVSVDFATAGLLSQAMLQEMDAYWRAANYLFVGQILEAAGVGARPWYSEAIQRHKRFVAENGDDLPEIRDWRWPARQAF